MWLRSLLWISPCLIMAGESIWLAYTSSVRDYGYSVAGSLLLGLLVTAPLWGLAVWYSALNRDRRNRYSRATLAAWSVALVTIAGLRVYVWAWDWESNDLANGRWEGVPIGAGCYEPFVAVILMLPAGHLVARSGPRRRSRR